MQASTSPLSISHISKTYQKQVVLDDVSFAVEPNEIFGLIGLNGVGKTTLIKTILQLTKADAGGVAIAGVPAHLIQSRYNLAYLPEKFQPSKYLTGFEYLELTLSYYGKTLDKQIAREQASKFSLAPEKLSQKISSYSKGMSQKIGLIGAFMCQAPLLILDEPMSGLDPVARIHLKQEMLAYRNSGRSIFFSSHILSDIDEICDRIGIIHNTELAYLGTPKGLKTQQGCANLEQAFLSLIL